MKKRLDTFAEFQKQEVMSHFMHDNLFETTTTGKVHSIFKHSFNIIVQNQLFNFSSIGMPLSAYGCLLDKSIIDHLITICKMDDLIRIDKNMIIFYTRNEIIKIDFNMLSLVDLTIPVLPLLPEKILSSVSYTTLSSLGLEAKIGLGYSKEINEIFNFLKCPTQNRQGELKRIVHFLMGRGKGLTPSGDDILMGYITAEKAFKGSSEMEAVVQKRLSEQVTTMVSVAYFKALYSNSISSLFVQFILSFYSSEEEYVNELIKKISNYGHTSGMDTLFGFYLGLRSFL